MRAPVTEPSLRQALCDAGAMAQAIERLLADTALAARLRAAALADVQRYRWDQVRDQLLAAYRDAREALRAAERVLDAKLKAAGFDA